MCVCACVCVCATVSVTSVFSPRDKAKSVIRNRIWNSARGGGERVRAGEGEERGGGEGGLGFEMEWGGDDEGGGLGGRNHIKFTIFTT